MKEMKFLHVTNKGMAFNPQTGDSYQLNESALFMIELLQDKLDQDEIVRRISDHFQLSTEEALSDFLDFSVQLKILGLIS